VPRASAIRSVYGEDEVAALAADPDVDGLWVTSPNFTRVEVIEAAVSAVDDGADLKGVAPENQSDARFTKPTESSTSLKAPASHTPTSKTGFTNPILPTSETCSGRGTCGGRPYIARSQAEHGGPHSEWFWDGRKQGGGALTDMLCHALGGNEFLLTDPGVVTSSPSPSRPTRRR